MKGLELCEKYFHEVGFAALRRECGDLVDRVAAGLVGDGSECYGYDDATSRDHDWGPGFCVWMTAEDYVASGEKAQVVYDNLPTSFDGYERLASQWGGGRVGAMAIGPFYERFIGRGGPPESLREWLLIPDNAFAAATNGKIFHDSLGEFSKIRALLLEHYPDDVRLKKLASRCMTTGQAGQYNFPRCAKRGEAYAAHHSETKFSFDAMSMVFLLNRKYAPFYKWLHRGVRQLPLAGEETYGLITALVEAKEWEKKSELIESISRVIIDELRRQGLSDSDSDYLPDHGPDVQARIGASEMSGLDVWVG
ncbi:MAG: DUF4037 domain-containing protein [Candidatus Hydrogenedentes bacterium]|jgi:hypothetical protein|nr:DUF4037 domain-containing protein [Candidatus Hydrogenedentota bacterium]